MRALLVTLLLIAAVIGAAYYFNWISFSTARTPEGGVTDFKVSVHGDQVREDLNRLKAAASRTAENVTDALKKEAKEEEKKKAETVRGVLREASTAQITVDVAGKSMTVKLTPETKIRMEGREGKASELRPGQEVSCTHERRGGENVCVELTVEKKK